MRLGIYLLLCFVGYCGVANAELKYEQELTISKWTTLKDVEKSVQEFCEAAQGDPDIKVVKVTYEQKKEGKSTMYSAKILCHVSTSDWDIVRIQGKIFQKRNNFCENTTE